MAARQTVLFAAGGQLVPIQGSWCTLAMVNPEGVPLTVSLDGGLMTWVVLPASGDVPAVAYIPVQGVSSVELSGNTGPVTGLLLDTQAPATAGAAAPLLVRSSVDPKSYQALMSHDRHLYVAPRLPYGYLQVGRLLFHDPTEAGFLSWSNASTGAGSIAMNAAAWLSPETSPTPASIALKGGATTAGDQGIARRFVPLPADQAFSGDLKLIVSCWFRLQDAHSRDFELWIRPDDSVQRWEAALRFHIQQAGVAQNFLEYLDVNGIFQRLTTYAIRPGSAAAGDPWHFVMLVLNYLQGSLVSSPPGRLNYEFLKFDDYTSAQKLGDLTAGVVAHPIASNGYREAAIDLVETADDASASEIDVAEVVVSDVASVVQL
jgi:hypothetical protein